MNPRRFLLSRTDRLGDLILSTPVATALKKEFPDAEIFFLAQRYDAEILSIHPHVQGVIDFDPSRARRDLIAQLRAYDFDAVLALFPRPDLAWVFYRAGIPMRIGTGYRWYGFLYTHRLYEHRKDARRHEAEYNLQLLRPMGIVDAKVEFHSRFSPQQAEQVHVKLAELGLRERFIVLHPGSGGSSRDWPPEHFAELAGHLGGTLRHQVVVTGHAHEKSLTQYLLQHAHTGILDLSGRLNLVELAGLLRRAELFVSNSTGPLHLAVMMKTPVMAFYPPITACRPERWGPYGRREDVLMSQAEECFRCASSHERACQCMRDISVAEAMQKAEEKLALLVRTESESLRAPTD
ncbi:MAG: glycosyltransferase family 9 protein [bacterium]